MGNILTGKLYQETQVIECKNSRDVTNINSPFKHKICTTKSSLDICRSLSQNKQDSIIEEFSSRDLIENSKDSSLHISSTQLSKYVPPSGTTKHQHSVMHNESNCDISAASQAPIKQCTIRSGKYQAICTAYPLEEWKPFPVGYANWLYIRENGFRELKGLSSKITPQFSLSNAITQSLPKLNKTWYACVQNVITNLLSTVYEQPEGTPEVEKRIEDNWFHNFPTQDSSCVSSCKIDG